MKPNSRNLKSKDNKRGFVKVELANKHAMKINNLAVRFVAKSQIYLLLLELSLSYLS